MNDDDRFLQDELFHLSDTVIYVEQIDPLAYIHEEEYNVSMDHVKHFFKQVDQKISNCKSETELGFVKDTTLNFLIFSLKKLITQYDIPDTNIEFLANHIKYQLLKTRRKTNE